LLSNSARNKKKWLPIKNEAPEFDVDDEVLLMGAIILDDDSDQEAKPRLSLQQG
jgi:hypothetical protein